MWNKFCIMCNKFCIMWNKSCQCPIISLISFGKISKDMAVLDIMTDDLSVSKCIFSLLSIPLSVPLILVPFFNSTVMCMSIASYSHCVYIKKIFYEAYIISGIYCAPSGLSYDKVD
ncbi:uncharacterized protein NESG_01267 [Nematocida ausubeli]|uniref:Uncharacterized protein n=1 Tax=Nematocida ausubeli (strain ATCC PRA-371 / ERTm2) TaxID=1913371 RepID=A0A086J1Y3_NEMA1|nr:uncharacterized protein NESG_01267 [Nematocida ausubeli]KFG26151.1 hypothetical protein NESG_01267 [Nematocida ausubeli]